MGGVQRGIEATCSCAGNVEVQVFGLKQVPRRTTDTSFAFLWTYESPNPNLENYSYEMQMMISEQSEGRMNVSSI